MQFEQEKASQGRLYDSVSARQAFHYLISMMTCTVTRTLDLHAGSCNHTNSPAWAPPLQHVTRAAGTPHDVHVHRCPLQTLHHCGWGPS
jgi:hypothetical protein